MSRAPVAHTSGGPDIERAAATLLERIGRPPEALVVLGSGLSDLADAVEDPMALEFEELPGFPPATVQGHRGRFVAGRFRGRHVIFQAGRYHAYEGHPMPVVVAPVRLAARLGARFLVLTNAAGGVHPQLDAGSLVLIDDHLDLTFRSALAGPVRPGERRFPDMSAPYDPELQRLALESAAERRVVLVRGTYVGLLGPSYETAAEVRMLRTLGGDVVGMSTVAEAITARAVGLRCVAFSVVANKAVGLVPGPLDHEEVLEAARRAGLQLGRVLEGLIERLPPGPHPGGMK